MLNLYLFSILTNLLKIDVNKAIKATTYAQKISERFNQFSAQYFTDEK